GSGWGVFVLLVYKICLNPPYKRLHDKERAQRSLSLYDIQRLLHLQPPPGSLKPIAHEHLRRAAELVKLPRGTVEVLLGEEVLRTREHAEHIVALNEALLLEADAREDLGGQI